MKKEVIQALFEKFEAASLLVENVEYWSARVLQDILGYTQWRNFINAIEKAKTACQAAGEVVGDHFADISKMVEIGSNTQERSLTLH
ncbi:hypothetical protein GCM10023093_14620 [Nemorincola caseinilytica]|uniref:DNA-damage-inducible protein D n=1 Tax=Nemorincola caseinilytica TaxID=2054315 RepID=A0ABP8NEU3_9BACT